MDRLLGFMKRAGKQKQRDDSTVSDPATRTERPSARTCQSEPTSALASASSSLASTPRSTKRRRHVSMSPRLLLESEKRSSLTQSTDLPERPSVLQDPLHGLRNSPELNITCIQNCVIRIDPRQNIRGTWLLEPCPPGQCMHDVEILLMPHQVGAPKKHNSTKLAGDWKIFENQAGVAIRAVLQMLGASPESVLRGHFANDSAASVIQEEISMNTRLLANDASCRVLREVEQYYVTSERPGAGWTQSQFDPRTVHLSLADSNVPRSQKEKSHAKQKRDQWKRSRSQAHIGTERV